MSETLHHPATVNAVARKIFKLARPLGNFDELDDDTLAEWQGEAVHVIDTALETPTEGIAFFEEIAPVDAEAAESSEELLEPWKSLISPVTSIGNHPSSGYREAVSEQVEGMRRGAKGKLSLVPSLGPDGTN